LYACKDERWKVSDFGFSAEGTSSRENATADARGTAGYRAPELMSGLEGGTFTKKVDIWAMGCILYKLAFGKKMFLNDWETMKYASAGESVDLPLNLGAIDVAVEYHSMHEPYIIVFRTVIATMLEAVPGKRPSACNVHELFALLASSCSGGYETPSVEEVKSIMNGSQSYKQKGTFPFLPASHELQ
jgi:serine/threonine protein kinase